jgi:hypothetical protein
MSVKKLMVLVGAVLLILSLGTAAMAATIYLDQSLGGKIDNSIYSKDYNPYYLGLDIPLSSWQIELNYNYGTWKYPGNTADCTNYTAKFGYSFVNIEAARVGVNLGDYYMEYKGQNGGISKFNNDITLGLEANFKLSPSFKLKLFWDDFVSGKYNMNGTDYDIKTLQMYQAKFTWMFAKSWGLDFGYLGGVQQAKFGSLNKVTLTNYILGFSYSF